MDYSQVNDPDHPDGTSPWQTSPAPDRTTFAPVNESVPSSPAANRDSPTGTENKAPPTPQTINDDSYSDPPTPGPPPQEEAQSSQSSERGKLPYRAISQSVPDIRFQGPPMTEEELRQENLKQQRAQERYQQQLHAQQHQRLPGRYHGGKQGQRQPPAYKLQARITSIERVGKKDPSIHFDVHVSWTSSHNS